jgi:hypothetical protein
MRVWIAKLQSCAEQPVCHAGKNGSALDRNINLDEPL